jgi:hypothetical protein
LLTEFQLNYVLTFLSQRKKLVQALSNLPSTIDEAYNNIMSRIEKGGPIDKDLALQTLSWVFHNSARTRPLKMAELCDLLVIEPGDSDFDPQYRCSPADILAVCQSLIILNESTGDVRFTHLTVHEFLRNYSELLKPLDLAKICLTYLSFDEFEKGKSPSREVFDTRLQKYRAANYVANFWGSYARVEEESPYLQTAILDFLASQNKIDSYLEMEYYDANKWKDYSEWKEIQALFDRQIWTHIVGKIGLTKIFERVLDGPYVF